MKVVVIGISGPSCSGKSTLTAHLAERVPATILTQDLYFRDPDECPPDGNFCDLRYLHTGEFIEAARELSNGTSVKVPRIDFLTFRRNGTRRLVASPVLIIEGMTIFRIPEVAEICDRRFYLDPPFNELTSRKLARDTAERGKTREIIEAQLRWMHEEHEYDLKTLEGTVEMIATHSSQVVDEIVNDLCNRVAAR